MFVAGVDGGGSKTEAIIADAQGHVLGVGRAGCGNHQINGVQAAVANIRQALCAALEQAGLEEHELTFVHYGLAGADRPHDFEILRPEIEAQLPHTPYTIECDVFEGLRIATADHTGVVLVCGSNTNAAGRSKDGKTAVVGGTGTLFGDRAGGYYLADQAFGRAIRAWEGREPHTTLVERIPAALGFERMADMVEHYLKLDPPSAPLPLVLIVHEEASAGDWLAIELLEDMGRELGTAAVAVLSKLGEMKQQPVPIVLTGSILQHGRHPLLLSALTDRVQAAYPNAYPVIPVLPPMFGALLTAMDQAGIETSADTLSQFESYLEANKP
ncbi:N-acetylglucosamine kinase [Paenibacillus sp. SYP-B4298]|uniref:N-acetylglucosamine kinase n=1 Tax=Paenibacillus sp. SYP-B4298 TaxID=2996034 RepID=UPI0022DE1FB1|nr:BadF/BadG/BcrA/BcrD ATPase family protein [Paenibacillus sp. SYP-B4298]